MKKISKSKKKRTRIRLKKGVLGIALVLVCSIVSVFYAFAATTPKFKMTADKTELNRGDMFTIVVSSENMQDVTSIANVISYDKDSFELYEDDPYDVYKTNVAKTKVVSQILPDDSDGTINFIYGVDTEVYPDTYINYNGDLYYLTFVVKDDATGGSHEFNFTNTSLELYDGTDSKDIDSESENLTVNVNIPVETVNLNSKDFTMNVGDNDQSIEVVYAPLDTTESKTFTFTSNNEDIVKVNDEGKLTAVGKGSTTITVSAFGQTFTVDVTVTNHIKNVSLNKNTLNMNRGENETLTATINPDDTDDSKSLNWTSSNTNVATVDNTGKVTAVGSGNTTITVTTVNGKTANCDVKVIVPLLSATISDETATLNKGETKNLSVTLDPTDATDNEITWSVVDDSIVSVDANGKVTALKGGKTKVKAKVGQFTLESEITVVVPVTSITVEPTNKELVPEQSVNVISRVLPEDHTEGKVTWESSDTTVATVDENGKVTALKPGTVTITAKVGSKTATSTIKVLIPIEGITATPNTDITINKGETETLGVIITPADAEESKNVTWESSDTSIATVDNTGKVTAVKGGEVTITGKVGKFSVDVHVTVEVPVKSISLNKEELSIEKGSNSTLKATVNPEDATRKNVSWTSSNTNVATVDNTGKVTAISNGTAVITATADNKSASCNIKVFTKVESVTINKSELNQLNNTLVKDNTINLSATVNPTDATNYESIEWTSSNTKIATVDNTGKVTAVKGGEVTITAKAADKTDSVTINVVVPITSFSISDSSVEIVKGKTFILGTTINPEDTTENTKITWTSANTSIATVDENGVITAVSKGTTKVTGTLSNGMKVECDVEVTIIPVQSINFEEDEYEVLKGKTESLKLIINPTNATEISDVSYESSDTSIATVDENGKVTALKEGKVTITAKMDTFEATAEITVKEVPLESIKVESKNDKISVGEKTKLNIVLNPSNTTDDLTITYKSSNEKVATVDENGYVYGVGPGKAKITVDVNGITSEYEITIDAITSPKTGITPISIFIGLSLVLISGIALVFKKKVSLK